MSSLDEAILRDQDRRRTASFTKAQGLIDSLLGRETGDISQAVGLLDVPLQQAKLGRGIGGDLGTISSSGLSARSDAASTLANTLAAAGSPMGNVMSVAGGMFPTAGEIRARNEKRQYPQQNPYVYPPWPSAFG